MSAWFIKRGNCLWPDEEAASLGMNRIKDGESVLLSIVRPRDGRWHRMYMATCQSIGENQDPPRDKESIDYELRIRAGHFDVIYVDGREIRMPKRLAFEKLSADGWEAIWPSLELAIRTHFGNEYLDMRAA